MTTPRFATFLLLFCFTFYCTHARPPKERGIRVFNNSGQTVEIFWIPGRGGGEPVLQSSPVVYHNHVFQRSSYVGHVFEIRQVSEECQANGNCMMTRFTVSDNDDQVYRILPNLKLLVSDNLTLAREKAKEIVKECENIIANMESGHNVDVLSVLQQIDECVEAKQSQAISVADDEIEFQANLRTNMALLLEKYTCYDQSMRTTDELYTEQWQDARSGGRSHTVRVMHERKASTIHLLSNFIRPEECAAIEERAKDSWNRASIVDDMKEGAVQEQVRRALDAPVKIQWKNGPDADPIVRLAVRIYDYANHVTEQEFVPDGQEDLIAIWYEGRGLNDAEPDQYRHHCDGPCFGGPYQIGDRMASMIMYCEMPEVGGATAFPRAGVHINARPGDAVFFQYSDGDTTDVGWTDHLGCPVLEGDKKVVTQWLRLGVDAENPWHKFDADGVARKAEMENMSEERSKPTGDEL